MGDTQQDVVSRGAAGQRVRTHSANRPGTSRRKLRGAGRHRGLVARSIGKPKLRERRRNEGNLKRRMISTLRKKKKKLRARNVLVRRLHAKTILSKPAEREDTPHASNQEVSTMFPFQENKFKDSSPETNSKSEISNVETTEVPATSKFAKRNSHKWRTLMKLGNTVSAGRASAQTPKKKRWERRAVEHKAKEDGATSNSASRCNITAGHTQTKDQSPDNSEWPALATPTRTRAHAKETATEIVKSKHSVSTTKTTRKAWADIVTRRSKEPVSAITNQQTKDKKKAETGVGLEKTWASVAAAGTSKCEASAGKPDASKTEACGEPSNAVSQSASGNMKRKRRKAGYSLAYTDKIWLTCQKSKGKPHVQSFYRRHFGDRKDKTSKRKTGTASPLKKMCPERPSENKHSEKQIEETCDKDSASQTSTEGTRSSSPRVNIKHGAHLKCTSSNRDSQGQNPCLIDNMPVVYTKKAGMVITLNESNHDRSTHKNVNKCNNQNHRARHCQSFSRSEETDSFNTTDVSGTDLCSQLSSMTFQTPTTSNYTIDKEPSEKRKTLRSQNSSVTTKQPSQSTGQSKATKALQVEGSAPTKQKKISLRYRALLRDGSGPLDARAVSDLHTRHKRADTLQDNRVAARAVRRRYRIEHQNRANSSRRAPATSPTADVMHPTRNGPSTRSRPTGGGKSPGSRATKGINNTREILVNLDEVANAQEASTSRNYGQADGATSSDSSGESVAWRPADNNGTNNSRCTSCEADEPGEVSNPQLASVEKHCSIMGPVLATSAPQLSERQNRIRLELSPNLHALDMNWWSAYLQQQSNI
ncbi:hypothetical protein ElyMa_004578200 [Elysia marginata]|uniref:Uncharacterized protein n=1 Tax=Elysia marginata TaxID=1093978 RepID=A0AAV4HTP9_9GAST|nr:hypothetical protein ElyMa_004578200 [Elysia marginata]